MTGFQTLTLTAKASWLYDHWASRCNHGCEQRYRTGHSFAFAAMRRESGAWHEGGLSRLTEEIMAANSQAVYRMTDVSRREDLRSLVALSQQSFGRLDVLFICRSARSTI